MLPFLATDGELQVTTPYGLPWTLTAEGTVLKARLGKTREVEDVYFGLRIPFVMRYSVFDLVFSFEVLFRSWEELQFRKD